MNTIRTTGHIDADHRLSADVPAWLPAGPVTVLIVPQPAEDDAGDAWMAGIVEEWVDDLGDGRQDIYTLADGEPVDET
jgi:hypothetical protein